MSRIFKSSALVKPLRLSFANRTNDVAEMSNLSSYWQRADCHMVVLRNTDAEFDRSLIHQLVETLRRGKNQRVLADDMLQKL